MRQKQLQTFVHLYISLVCELAMDKYTEVEWMFIIFRTHEDIADAWNMHNFFPLMFGRDEAEIISRERLKNQNAECRIKRQRQK